jgi:hypothetical protein
MSLIMMQVLHQQEHYVFRNCLFFVSDIMTRLPSVTSSKNFKHVIMQYPGIAHEHHLLYSKRDTGGKFSDNGPVPISFDDEIVFEGTVTNHIINLDP